MRAPLMLPRTYRPQGSILIVTLVLMLLLMVVGAGLILRGMKASQGMTQMQHYSASVSCADGARQLLVTTFATYNTPVGNLKLVANNLLGENYVSGHYDAFGIASVSQLNANQVMSSGPNECANSRCGGSNGNPYVATVICQDTSGQSRSSEVEYLIHFGAP